MNILEFSPEADGAPAAARPPSVCIVTFEFVGLYKNGGIGTVSTGLAEILAQHGHDVTVAFTRPELLSPAEFEAATAACAAKGITLVPLHRTASPDLHGPLGGFTCWERVAVYRWLRDRRFDIVHFSEHLGEAFYCLAARRLGLGFHDTEFWIGCHGPSQWVIESNEDIVRDMFWAYADHAERFSIANADVVWAPSRYLLNWMWNNGYAFPARTVFQRYVVPDDLDGIGWRAGDAVPPDGPAQELVLFGRLETRKGVKLFCQAIDRLADRLAGRSVTFMGRIGVVDNRPADVYIRERAAHWPFEWRIIDNFGRHEAYRYVTQPGRLAVLASPVDNSPCAVYELLEVRAAFIACNSGGIPELIDPASHADTLFDYTLASLTARLEQALEGGAPRPQPAVSRSDNKARLIAAHGRVRPLTGPGPAAAAAAPLTAVVMYEGDAAALARTAAALAASPLATRLVVVETDRRGGLSGVPPQTGIPTETLNLDVLDHAGVMAALLDGDARGFLVLRAGVRLTPEGVETLARGLAAPGVAGIVPFSTLSPDGVRPVLSGDMTYGLFEGTAASGGVLSRAALETLAAGRPMSGTNPLLWFDAAALAGLNILPLAEPLLDESEMPADAFRRVDDRTRLSLYGASGDSRARFIFEAAFGALASPPPPPPPAPSPAPAPAPILPTVDLSADDATLYRQLAESRSYLFGLSVLNAVRRLTGRAPRPASQVSADYRRGARDLLLSSAWDIGALIRLPARALRRLRR